MKHILFFSLSIVTLFRVEAQYSQYFVPPINEDHIGMAREFFVVTMQDDTLWGNRLPAAMLMDGQVRSFTLRQEDKTKVKFKAHEVKRLAIKPTDFMKVSSAMAIPNLLRALETDWSKIAEREWVYFEQAPLPKKDNKYALMQLLNDGFDSKIKVYLRPNSNETATNEINGVQISGGEDNSYIIVQDGKSEIYKKRKYKQEALTKLFKNCDVFVENYSGEKMKWKDISEHILLYDRLCGENGTK